MIRQLAHVCVHSMDLSASERYYCGALGMRKAFEFRRGEDLFGFYLDAGHGTFIEVFQGKPGDGQGAIRHLCLEVDDVDRVAAALKAGGYQATERKLGCDQSWQVWSADPDGVNIEFHQYTAESAQRRRQTVRVDW